MCSRHDAGPYMHQNLAQFSRLHMELTNPLSFCAAQDITEANVSGNSAAVAAGGGTAEVAELSWGVTDVGQMGTWAAPDLVIAADVIYDRQLFDPLLQTFNGYGATCGPWKGLQALRFYIKIRVPWGPEP